MKTKLPKERSRQSTKVRVSCTLYLSDNKGDSAPLQRSSSHYAHGLSEFASF